MRIAYLILAHKNLTQLALLVDMLCNNTQHYCFIHLDKRLHAPSVIKQVKDLTKSRNWHVIKKRTTINWGGFSMLDATLNLIIEELNHTIKFDYLSLHSGMDLPIKPNKIVTDYLKRKQGKQFVEFYEIPNYKNWADDGALDRINYYWFIDELGSEVSRELIGAQKLNKMKRQLPINFDKIYGGSQWWTLTADCAAYIIHFLNNTPGIIHFFKYTHIPDELFFHTILLNSTYKKQVVNNNLRMIDWETNPSRPKIMDISDLERLERSDRLFARKFDKNVDAEIISYFKQKLVWQH